MGNKIDNHHPKPCANCGHRNLHGDVSGCVANKAEVGAPADWCDCRQYVARTPAQVAADRAEGIARGEAGADAALHGHSMTYDAADWRAKAETRLAELIAAGVVFTAEDVTSNVGVAPSPSAIGGLFKGRKDMAPVGFTVATRPEAHGRPLRTWKGLANA